MNEQRDDGWVPGVGASDRPPDEDARIDAFVGALDDPDEIRRRGRAMSAEDEAEYLARAEEDDDYRAQIEEEAQSWRDEGVDVDGGGEEVPGDHARGSQVPLRVPKDRRVRIPAGREPVGLPEGAEARGVSVARTAESPAEGAAARGVSPSLSGHPGRAAGAVAVEGSGRLSEAQFLQLTELLGDGLRLVGEAVDKGIGDVKGAMPAFREGEVGELVTSVKKLEELLRLQKSDGARRREVGRRWWRWPLRVLAVGVLLAMFGGGVVVQWRWSVVDDGTNGWKEIVWKRHGMTIAECIDRADKRGGGARCGVTAQVR